MFSFTKTLIDGGILSLLASIWLIVSMCVNPRIFLHDYPPAIQEKVPKKTGAEKRLTYVFGVPFMLLLLMEKIHARMQAGKKIICLWEV